MGSLKDRVKKLTIEKEALECQLKNEKDEKELYKVKPLSYILICKDKLGSQTNQCQRLVDC